jgi:hypothetical protein
MRRAQADCFGYADGFLALLEQSSYFVGNCEQLLRKKVARHLGFELSRAQRVDDRHFRILNCYELRPPSVQKCCTALENMLEVCMLCAECPSKLARRPFFGKKQEDLMSKMMRLTSPQKPARSTSRDIVNEIAII